MKRLFITMGFLITATVLIGCPTAHKADYYPLKGIMESLVLKAQVCIEEGYWKLGEKAALKCVRDSNPNLYDETNQYRLRVNNFEGTAILLICDGNKAIYEYTSCDILEERYGDYTETDIPCQFQLSNERITALCR